MNVIRINWQFVRCLFLFLLIFYAFKVLLSFLLFTDYSTLSYDSGSQHFFIKSKVLTSSDGIFRESDRVPFQIKSATIHYTQIPEQLWLNVLEKASKLGLNTIEIIIPWGIHEPFPNQFDFSSKSNDLDTFINLVHHLNLHLLVRFDPFYQDSNYDFGGLPAWLLGYNFNSKLFDLLDLKEETFQHRYNEYLKTLLTIINRNQRWKNEGPIIGVVVQKIYGSNSKNSIIKFFNENYIKFIENQLYKYDIEEMLLSSRSVCEIGLNLTFCDPNIYIYQPAMLDNDLPLPKNFPGIFF
jgi:beta-galactosidase